MTTRTCTQAPETVFLSLASSIFPLAQNCLQELHDGYSLIAQYTDYPGQWGGLASQRRATDSSYYGFDLQWTGRILVAQNQLVSDSYVYDAFGVELAATGSTVNSYRYKGQYEYRRDTANRSDVWHNQLARDLGRWISPDALSWGSGWTPYAYCGSNPVAYLDPFGLYAHGKGHHWVPSAVFGKMGFSAEARAVFDKSRTPWIKDHGWSTPHAAYNDEVKKMLKRHLRRAGIRPSQMTERQAFQFVESVRRSSNPVISSFLRDYVTAPLSEQGKNFVGPYRKNSEPWINKTKPCPNKLTSKEVFVERPGKGSTYIRRLVGPMRRIPGQIGRVLMATPKRSPLAMATPWLDPFAWVSDIFELHFDPEEFERRNRGSMLNRTKFMFAYPGATEYEIDKLIEESRA